MRTNQIRPIARLLLALLIFVSLPFAVFGQVSSPVPSSSASASAQAHPSATPELGFVIQYTSVQIPGGIRGIAPGTPVTIIEDRGDVLKVRSDDLQFEIKKVHVTKDSQLARKVSQADERSQQQTLDSITAQKQRISQQQQAEAVQQNQLIGDDELRNLEAQYRALQAQEGDLLLKIGKAQQWSPWFNQRGKIIHREPDQTHSQLPLLQGRLRDVQHEKDEARRRLEEAQRHHQQHP